MNSLDTKIKVPITNRARNPEQASLLADMILHRDELHAVLGAWLGKVPRHYQTAIMSGVKKILMEEKSDSEKD